MIPDRVVGKLVQLVQACSARVGRLVTWLVVSYSVTVGTFVTPLIEMKPRIYRRGLDWVRFGIVCNKHSIYHYLPAHVPPSPRARSIDDFNGKREAQEVLEIKTSNPYKTHVKSFIISFNFAYYRSS